MKQAKRSDSDVSPFDIRDRLILALYAQLKAERQTREAIEWVIRDGGLSPEVLEAMASDPVPVSGDADIPAIERILSADRGRFAARNDRGRQS